MTNELLVFFTGFGLGAFAAGVAFGGAYAGFVLRAGHRRECR